MNLPSKFDSEAAITRTLALHELKHDDVIQPRVELDPSTVEDYAGQMMLEVRFPPVVVFHDGSHYWLADGYHRAKAAEQAGRDEIEAEIRAGTKADAMRYACSANTKHGLRMTNADKRRVTDRMLRLKRTRPEEAQLSQHQIATLCGVTQAFVSKRETVLFPARSCKSAALLTGGHAAYASDNGYHPDISGDEVITTEPDAVTGLDIGDAGTAAALADHTAVENEPMNSGIPTDLAARIIESVMLCLHPFAALPPERLETALTEAVAEIRRRIYEVGN